MNFYTYDKPMLYGEMFFLDLCYTTEQQGKTQHWFLCLNDGFKHQFSERQMNQLKRIRFSDIPPTLETK